MTLCIFFTGSEAPWKSSQSEKPLCIPAFSLERIAKTAFSDKIAEMLQCGTLDPLRLWKAAEAVLEEESIHGRLENPLSTPAWAAKTMEDREQERALKRKQKLAARMKAQDDAAAERAKTSNQKENKHQVRGENKMVRRKKKKKKRKVPKSMPDLPLRRRRALGKIDGHFIACSAQQFSHVVVVEIVDYSAKSVQNLFQEVKVATKSVRRLGAFKKWAANIAKSRGKKFAQPVMYVLSCMSIDEELGEVVVLLEGMPRIRRGFSTASRFKCTREKVSKAGLPLAAKKQRWTLRWARQFAE